MTSGATQLVKAIPAHYENQMPIAAFTRTRHWYLLRIKRTHSTTLSPTVSLTHILILSSNLRLDFQGRLFPSGFVTKLYTHFASLQRRNTHLACSMMLVISGKWRIIQSSRPVTVLPEEDQEKFHVYAIVQTRKRITSGKHGHIVWRHILLRSMSRNGPM
jgi:hypothetical protein